MTYKEKLHPKIKSDLKKVIFDIVKRVDYKNLPLIPTNKP
jgi:hypothetical protein